ncbi:RES family NAD+ phosphorylase [Novosphingobium album (ex Hu et al. 2023)]|uniref:RES family NAD+ phosphorylase n=1 Tax=Novosphingobium album (ex Hu et al. 2023) TaxID=2930093 RepID=A0ABT0AYP1_9SPHN|nr:RES family NAD+ phosphorylase [Novosphingobium album (ex Hu et al. 2023)]MCJ2177917.1 RES family NAD+ phosphorylase [Novosphingobium album (ex Hu et al. 2023)]
MKLWRLCRAGHVALDGGGSRQFGGRYTPAGSPVVNFASDAALAILIALRYQPRDLSGIVEDFVLGWTEIDAEPVRVPPGADEDEVRGFVREWLDEGQALLAAVPSRVLPEGEVVMMNVHHPDAGQVAPLVTRPFSFAQCLHTPPMADRYGAQQ